MRVRTWGMCAGLALAAGGVFWWLQSRAVGVTEPFERHRPEFRAIAEKLRQGSNPWFGTRQVDELRRKLADPALAPFQQMRLRVLVGYELLRLGETAAGVAEYEHAAALVEQHRLRVPADMHAWMGLAYMRQAEELNCIARHNRDCCLFPLAEGGVHSVSEPARKARDHYREYLKAKPDDLARLWLLNIASMALGEYPDGVPERFRVPPAALASEYDIGRFVDVASDLGVDAFNLCGGAIAEDFDGDGRIDIVTSSSDPAEPVRFFRNTGEGFEDASARSRIDDQLGGLNCIGGDYDNDGDVDVLILRGAWLHDDGQMRNSLLRNEADGTFTDVTHAAGLADAAYPTQTAVWGDFDNDGDLDLYVGNESRPTESANYPNQLFRNNGDATFTDIAREAGVANDGYCKGVAAGDYDNDGDLDLYVSNIGPNRLFRNAGDGTFTDEAEPAGVVEPSRRSFAVWFFDYDNDGDLDLFVAAYEATVADVAAHFLGKSHEGRSPCLYRNDGDGTFTDVAAEVGLGFPCLPMGANFGDLDNDGWLDVYLTTGDPEYATLTPNVMLRNDGGRRFQNVTKAGGFGHLQKGHGVAFADFDNDGDQDIYNQLGGFFPGDKFRNALFRNPGHGNRFLIVELVGTRNNRRAIGARIEVVASGPDGVRSVHRAVGSVSSFGGSPARQEIGLGTATRVDRVVVRWPGSTTAQVAEGVGIDARIEITEGRDGFAPLPLPAARLQK